jgi:hypothetical protein
MLIIKRILNSNLLCIVSNYIRFFFFRLNITKHFITPLIISYEKKECFSPYTYSLYSDVYTHMLK